jgi:hypothetical protein
MLVEGKFYINSIGNKCKCVKIENGKATVWVHAQIPPEQRFKLAGENGKEETIRTTSAVIVQDLSYSHLYHEITDKNEIQRLSRIYDRQHKGIDRDKLKTLQDKLQKIDQDLAGRKVRLLMRPFEAFDTLSPGGGVLIAPSREDYFDEFEGPNLFKKISDWYEKRYGEEMYINPKIGEKPFRLRGHVYYFKYPVVFGTGEVNIFKCIQHITPELARSLSPQELEDLKKEFERGYNAYNSMGIHRILDAFEECAKVDKRLQSIRAHIDKLNLKDMSIRYAKTGHTEDDAIEAIDSMLQACSFITDIWFRNPRE